MDQLFDMNELQRSQARAEMSDEPAQFLFLVGLFTSSASIPIAPSLTVLQSEHRILPAAFYAVLRHSLWKWMYVYDYEAAARCAEMGLIDMEESELADSIYPQVAASVPDCLRNRLTMNPHRGLAFVKALQPQVRGSAARELISQLLNLSECGSGYRHAWPGRLVKETPGLEEYLDECDGIGPGCLLNWYEGDPISACYDEQMTYVGQNGPLEPTILRVVKLSGSEAGIDAQVRGLFDYVGAMVRSLACAAKLTDTIRDINDEHLRKNRVESGLSVEPSSAGVRDE